MKYRLQRVDLQSFLADEIPAHELSPDLRQQLRHALATGQELRGVAAQAVRELQRLGLLLPAGTLRAGKERVPLHALVGSSRVYDLRGLLDEWPAPSALQPPPATAPAAPDAPADTQAPQATNRGAWASLSGVRALLRRDWVSYGLEASLAELLGEIRARLNDPELVLMLWEGALEAPLQLSEIGCEIEAEHGPVGRRLSEALRHASAAGAAYRGRQWFGVWAQQRCCGALGLQPQVEASLAAEAAAAVGDLLAAFLRSQLRVFTDALTGVHNRAFFDHQFAVELERSRRANLPLAVLFCDLDHFKRINDNFGHAVGDTVLQHAARLFVTHLRRIDYVFRWGGEEFAILLPATDRGEALHTAERLRATVASTPVTLEDGRSVHVTVSIGMALFPYSASSERELLRLADQALYRAKEDGRDRVHLWQAARGSSD
jgi:diguanylate cyclase (GGDEF)-like protein